MSFDYFNSSSSDPFGDAPAQPEMKSRGAFARRSAAGHSAPWFLLVIGLFLSLGAAGWQLVAPPAGSSVITGNFVLWLLSLLAFLVPIAIFTVVDLRRQLSLAYKSNRHVVQNLRTSFVLFGLLASMIQVYALATAISKALNAA